MFVVPPLGASGWRRGVRVSTPVEAVDLMPTLADLAGLPMPKLAYGGESLRALIAAPSPSAPPPPPRQKTWALMQWPRRPSCTTQHSCPDGGGDPFDLLPDAAVMGYRLRTEAWAYVAWVKI
jgi:hypothetical protein